MREPQEVYLAQLLSEAHTMRNETAMSYTRGKTKAKKNNLKRFMDECNYLKQQGVLTLSDFERYLSSVGEKVEASKFSMNQGQQCMKELQQLMEDAKVYRELKPVFDESKKNIVLPKQKKNISQNMKVNFAGSIWSNEDCRKKVLIKSLFR